MKAAKVNAGLAESNGKLLLPGLWLELLHVTCGLTACTPGSAPGPTLGNEYGKTLLYLYPQNGNRIVIIDSVTFLHPMYTHRTSQWILVWRTHTCIGPLDLDPSPSHNPHITCDTANDTIQCNSFRIILKVATTMHNIFHQRSPPYFKDLVTFSVSGVTAAPSTTVISSQVRRCPSNNNSVRSSRFFSPGPHI